VVEDYFFRLALFADCLVPVLMPEAVPACFAICRVGGQYAVNVHGKEGIEDVN
jgi:hypothetical protein